MNKEIKSINWEELLVLTSNKPELAKELVTMFGNELPDMQDKINTSYKNKDYEMLQGYIHQLHGSCCYTAANLLKTLAHDTEEALKLQNYGVIDGLMRELNLEIEQLITTINQQAFEDE